MDVFESSTDVPGLLIRDPFIGRCLVRLFSCDESIRKRVANWVLWGTDGEEA